MADTLREMPTDADIDMLRDRYGIKADDASRSPRSGARGLFGRNYTTRRGTRIPNRLNNSLQTHFLSYRPLLNATSI